MSPNAAEPATGLLNKAHSLQDSEPSFGPSYKLGKMGDRQIADMWKQYYEQLYCAKYVNVTMSAFLDKLTSLHDINHFTGLFSVDDVQTAILQQISGKAVGPDGIHIEAYCISHFIFQFLFALWIFTERSHVFCLCPSCKK